QGPAAAPRTGAAGRRGRNRAGSGCTGAPGLMLALAYVALMVLFGDTVSRPFFNYASRLHRLATAFLVGLVTSTWLSYLAAFAFRGGDKPLIAGDALAAWIMAIVIAMRLAPEWWRRRALRRADAGVASSPDGEDPDSLDPASL